MGLLDSVIGAIGGASAAGNSGMAGGLAGGGGRGALISLVVGMLMNRAQGGGGAGGGGLGSVLGGLGGGLGGAAGSVGGAGGMGGLGDLIGRFQQGGLGDVVGSWIGTGHNLPVSPAQVHSALGDDVVSQVAQHLGVSHGEAASQLSDVLPEVVDTMTPNGALPPDGHFGDIGEILGRFGNRL